VFAAEGTVNTKAPFWHTVAAEAVIVGVLGSTCTVEVLTPVTADWQVTPPAKTVNRTVAVFAPAAAVLNV
jgi:hypothetical protein